MRERILITGPGGRIGPHIVPLLREQFALRLFDMKPLQTEADDEFVQGDIRDFDALRQACQGVRALVHLAAVSDEDDFLTRLLPMNIVGSYNAFEAARQAGVPTLIYASTGQTVLFYPKGQWVTPEMPPRPWTIYACTKLFGEALARYYSDRHGLAAIVLRICYFRSYADPLLRVPGHDAQREWISPKDLTQLIVKSIRTDLKFAIFFGVSNNGGRFWDISNAEEGVGYHPEDNAARYLQTGNQPD
jgi:uronate dehydrogenase